MTPQVLSRALKQLADIDADIAKAISELGKPAPRNRPASFETFFSTIVSQQTSTHAAAAIMGRVRKILPRIGPKALLNVDDELLREAGMSYRKIEYAKGFAQSIVEKSFNIAKLAKLDNDEVTHRIIELKGFGRWSAEIFLMFSLDRRDVFPADDLALRVALAKLKNLPEKPTAKQARELTKHWAPQRTAGALFLWHYHKGAPA